jgi:hypothetical protein
LGCAEIRIAERDTTLNDERAEETLERLSGSNPNQVDFGDFLDLMPADMLDYQRPERAS